MKKILSVLLFFSVNFELVFAGTSGINGEYIFYLVPLVVLSAIWVGYVIKAGIKARKIARLEAMMALEAEETSSVIEPSDDSEL